MLVYIRVESSDGVGQRSELEGDQSDTQSIVRDTVEMDIPHLCAVLQGCLSTEANVRSAAEALLKQAGVNLNYIGQS